MEIPVFIREFIRASFMMRVNRNLLDVDEEAGDSGTCKFWQPWLDTEDNNKQSTTKQLPTAKWKRDRRSRLPEYSRKSDPKIPEVFGATNGGGAFELPTTPPSPDAPAFQNGTSQQTAPSPTTPPPLVCSAASQTAAPVNGGGGGGRTGDLPLDMSVRQRGLPPSYSQTVNNPNYRSNYRRTAVVQGTVREDLPSGISMCDPIIDEHFRRSLGEDYLTLFTNNNVAKEPPRVKTPPKVTTNVIELMDSTGLSVDDHFAKALGDTWLKLNKKDAERNANTASDMVSI